MIKVVYSKKKNKNYPMKAEKTKAFKGNYSKSRNKNLFYILN